MATVVMCPGLGEVDKRGGILGCQFIIHSSSKSNNSSFFLLSPHLSITMPRITQNTYRIHEVSVSRTEQGRYPHSCANVIDPYPKNACIIDRLDGDGNSYLDNPMNDLYNEDFLWGTSIQTARLQNECRIGHSKRDRVLDHLITMGVQDLCSSREPGMATRGRNVLTSLEMRHASSIGSRQLSRIDTLEREVGCRTSLLNCR